MTVTEFLNARISEDEAVARRGEGATIFKDADFGDVDFRSGSDESILRVSQRHLVEMHRSSLAMLEGMARWLPARVLAECAAKRSLVGLLQSDSRDPHNAMRREWADEILRAFATVYAEHPDYDVTWRNS